MNRVLTRRFFSALTVLALAGVAVAQDEKRPNFTGTWKMNPEKSDYGRLPKPTKFDRKIVHADPSVNLTSTFGTPQGEVVTEFKYSTDGKESSNSVRGTEVKSIGKWEGPTLVINSKRGAANGVEITTAERWTLSEDGKSMMVHTTIVTPKDETKTLVFYDKQ